LFLQPERLANRLWPASAFSGSAAACSLLLVLVAVRAQAGSEDAEEGL